MSVSVNTSNTVSRKILNIAAYAGSHALAADWLRSPMGASGGAIFGTVLNLSETVLIVATDNLRNHPEATNTTKTVAALIVNFGSYAAAWGVLTAMGISWTLTHAVSFFFLSIVTGLIVDIFFRVVSERAALSCV